MLTHVAGLARGLLEKRKRDHSDYFDATVTVSEMSKSKWFGDRGEASALVLRAQQTALMCAERNSRVCANQILRLYIPKRSGGKRRDWTSIVPKGRAKYLRKSVRYAENAGDFEEVVSHPVLDLLNAPNPIMSSVFFFQSLYMAAQMAGNGYMHCVQPTTRGVSELWPMQPQNVWIMLDRTNYVVGYGYGRDAASERAFGADEVIHYRHAPHPRLPYMGMGPLHVAFNEADIESASTENELAMWRNGARPDYVMEAPPDTTDEQVKDLERRVNASHRGPRNKGKFLVARAIKVQPIQFTPKEMEYIAGRQDIERRIWAAFGLPESEVRMNDANLASSLTGSTQYLRQTIRPAIDSVADLLTKELLPKFGADPGEMWFAYDNCVPSDETGEANRLVALVNARILTTNEARAELNREPIDGGDALQAEANAQATLAGQDVNTTDGSATGNAVDASAQGVQASGSEGVVVSERLSGIDAERAANLLRQVSTGEQSPEVVTGILLAMGIPADTVASMVAAADAFVPAPPPEAIAAQQSQEQQSQSVSDAGTSAGEMGTKAYADRRHLHTKDKDEYAPNVGDEQIAAMQRMTESLKEVFLRQPVDVRGETIVLPGLEQELAAAIRPYARQFLQAGVRWGYRELSAAGVSSPLEVTPVRAMEFLNSYTISLSRGLSDTTQADLKSALSTGLGAGESLAQLNARVAGALQESAGWRAERIARTETVRSYVEGSRLAYRDNGIEKERFILSAEPCPQCVEAAAMYREPQPIGTMTVPVHPQCRCAIAPVVDLGEESQ